MTLSLKKSPPLSPRAPYKISMGGILVAPCLLNPIGSPRKNGKETSNITSGDRCVQKRCKGNGILPTWRLLGGYQWGISKESLKKLQMLVAALAEDISILNRSRG